MFDEEKNAVEHLFKVKPRTSPPRPPSWSTSTTTSHRPRSLRRRRVCANAKCQKEIDKANEDMGKGDAERGATKPKDAIEHYKHAWEHAQKAIKEKELITA